jgi:TPP-dependent pyruvate/acetoin dehydrogenase alpha subunit
MTLLANGDAAKEDLLAIDTRVGAKMEAAISSAEASPFPAPESALNGAYA